VDSFNCDCSTLLIMVDEAAMDSVPVTIGTIVIAICPAVEVILV
jgi:hypothetical protein